MNSQPVRRETILIVDDKPHNLRLLAGMLESQGYQVKKAIAGKIALQAVQVVLPDLILLDINLPEMDGYKICEILKLQDTTRFIPVIFISAFNEVIDKVKGFQVGGTDYITKPFQLEEVLVRVENQLNQQRLYKQLQQQNNLLQKEINARQRLEGALVEANRQLEYLALIDGLTKVANRRKFDECLRNEWNRLAREKLPLSLILCDVDFFKDYNDTYGHIAGDECLQQIATAIDTLSKRPSDLVARYGGEEFAVILPNTNSHGAIYLGEVIRETVNSLKIAHVKSKIAQSVTLSVGVATTIPDLEIDPEVLIDMTDKALYTAKTQGRNRVVAFQE